MALLRSPLAARDLAPELMDDPDLDAAALEGALRGLHNIHRLSASVSSLWRELRPVLATGGRMTLLDAAAGDAHLSLSLAARARIAGIDMTVHAVDCNPVSLELAEARARQLGISFTAHCCNLCSDELPVSADIVLCSLFLHHLSEEQTVSVLRRLGNAARRILLVSDLERGVLHLGAAWLVSRLFTTSSIVHYDAPQSVRAAYSIAELAQLAQNAGLAHARLVRRWPFRLVLEWEPKSCRAA